MVLLVHKLSRSLKFPSKFNHHRHNSEPLSASLLAFRSNISNSLNQILLNLDPGSDFLSRETVKRFLELLSWINNKAFASLVVSIDYPISKWEAETVEEYLNYSLNCMELLNCVSSCLSRLSHDRLSLSHALNIVESSRNLKRIQRKDPGKHFKVYGVKGSEESEERNLSGNEMVIHRALLVMKSVSLWVFGIIISGLCSDVKLYNEMRILAGEFDDSLLENMDSKIGKEFMELKEVKFVNDAVDDNNDAKELKTRLEILEKLLIDIDKETSDLFSEILAARNKLLDNVRFNSRSNSTS